MLFHVPMNDTNYDGVLSGTSCVDHKMSDVQKYLSRTTKGVHSALCCTCDDVHWQKTKERCEYET